MKTMIAVFIGLLMATFVGASVIEGDDLATLRHFALNGEPEPPVMSKTINNDRIPARSYPMQPPIIPHKIDNYQVDLNVNKCMACHARSRVEETQARMISVTHYMDRDGNFLAELSPRRYFCQQCHVVQTDAKPWWALRLPISIRCSMKRNKEEAYVAMVKKMVGLAALTGQVFQPGFSDAGGIHCWDHLLGGVQYRYGIHEH